MANWSEKTIGFSRSEIDFLTVWRTAESYSSSSLAFFYTT